MNVLIFPAGTELGREIYLSLQFCKDVKLFLGGADYENQARYYAEPYAILPSVSAKGWVEELDSWLVEHRIDYVFPAHDEALVALVQQRENLSAHVLACEQECCELIRSKSRTYQRLKNIVPTPQLYSDPESIERWPVFVKPDIGQGANGARLVHDLLDLRSAQSNSVYGPLITCEYLPGDEFTVDCFSDRQSGLLFCQARTRERIRNGIAMASQNVQLEEVERYARAISDELEIYGAWFFQLKQDRSGKLVLLEVAPRIAGTMALNRGHGVNFPLLTLYEHLRKSVTILPTQLDARLSRSLVNKYKCNISYQHVYVDFDDTIIFRGEICLPVIQFLYQCLNQNKHIYLISRHRGDLSNMLKKFRIYDIFDEVIHIVDGARKSDYIVHDDAIFIDDSFSERLDVSLNKGLKTFDNSMLDVLIQ